MTDLRRKNKFINVMEIAVNVFGMAFLFTLMWFLFYRYNLEAGFLYKKGTAVLNRGLMFYPVDGEAFVPEMEAEFEGKLDAGLNVSSLGGYYTELRYFIEEIIQGNGKPIAPLSEAIKSAQLVWKEIESAGGKVKK